MALLDQAQILVDGLLAAVEVVMVTPVHLETNPQLPVVQAVVDVVKLETHPAP